VRESTRVIGHTLSPGPARHPPIGDRVFTISLSEYSTTVLGQPLLRRVHDLAPDASIQMRIATREVADGDRGLPGCDLRIAPPRLVPGGQPEVLLRDRFVYVADPANPRLADGRLTVEDLAALPHATARFADQGADPVVMALLLHGISPNVTLTTAGWLPLPFLVAGTDLVAAVPERLARRVTSAAGVTVTDPPFGTIEFVEAAWWHPMHRTDPALTWLRGVVREVAASLAGGRGQLAPDSLDHQAHLVGDEAQIAIGRGEHGEA
jgi:DNA-binding transcriptional LysR family regulator